MELPDMPPLVLSIDEARLRLGVSRSTVYRLLEAGEIHAIRIRDRRVIPTAELDRFVTERLAEQGVNRAAS